MNTLVASLRLVSHACHAIDALQTCCYVVAFQEFRRQLALFVFDIRLKAFLESYQKGDEI
jgi:hypothetical protein